MLTTIKVDNLKCGGCASSIQLALLAIKGVGKVSVNNDTDEVTISYADSTNLNTIREKLKHLGYPEKGTTEGLEKFAMGVKSYVSCAIGRLNEKEETNDK